MQRFVVLGGGYAGTLAALRLAWKPAVRRGEAEVVLVDAKAAFVERIRLHERVAGGGRTDAPYERLLAGSGVRFVQARVERIEAGELRWAGGGLSFDALIVALGSEVDRDRVPGVRRHALAVGNAEQARVVSGTVAVVGGGLTGLETATELAEAGRSVRLVTSGRIGDDLSERGAAYVSEALARLGVDVVEGARALAVDERGVVTATGRVDADEVVWAGPMKAPRLLRDAGFAVDDAGRAVAAVQAGRDPEPFRFAYVVRCIGLGRRDGLLQWVDAEDAPRGVWTGRLAAAGKEAICRYTTAMLDAQRAGIDYRWPRWVRETTEAVA